MRYENQDVVYGNPAFKDIGTLPSHFAPYSFKKIYVRPFELKELTLLSRAATLKEDGPLIRAVDLVISEDVNQLTIGDFYYILAWLRLYSRPEVPYIGTWTCQQPLFTHKETGKILSYAKDAVWPTEDIIERDYEASVCGHANAKPIRDKNLRVLELDESDYTLPEGFDFPRVNILIDLQGALQDPDLNCLAPGIQWIAGETWADKVKAAEENPLKVYDGLTLNKRINIGVDETVTYHCDKCQVAHEQSLVLSPRTFFQ